MNKGMMINYIANKTGLTKADSANAFEAVLEGITETVAEGKEVRFVGFGTFYVSSREARTGRNPQTGATINIPASKSVRFRSGSDLKAAL